MTRDTPEEWDHIRRNVYRRDQYTCQNCGAEGGPHGNTELHTHHIVPRKYGGVDAPRNLITLCPECHADAHEDNLGPLITVDPTMSDDSPDADSDTDVPDVDLSAAIEDLQSVVLSVNPEETQEEAVKALGSLGKPAIPALAHIAEEGTESPEIQQLALKQIQHIEDE